MKCKKKTGMLKTIQNNGYLIRISFKACPSCVIGIFLSTILRYGIIHMYYNIFFIEKIMRIAVEKIDYEQAVAFVLFSVLFLGVGYIICGYCDKLVIPVGSQILYERLHMMMLTKAMEVDLECFENTEFYNKYTKASLQIKGKTLSIINEVAALVCIIFNTVYLIYKSAVTDVYVLLLVILPIISTYVLGVKINKIQFKRYEENVTNERIKAYIKRVMYLQDYAKELRVSNIFNVLMRDFSGAVRKSIVIFKNYGFKLVIIHFIQSAFNYSFTIGCTICYASIRLIYLKNITPADFVVLVSIISNFTWNIVDAARNMTRLQDNSQYINEIMGFMEYKSKISECQKGLEPEEKLGNLSMHNVSFTYRGQKTPVLKNINLEIKTGQKIALVGHNGAGKTTLVKLLMRLYDVEKGEIILNQNNIKEYCVKSYRKLFGTVFQDYRVFSLSIAENVMMDDVNNEDRIKVEQALTASGVYEKIKGLQYGIDTILTKEFDEEGVNLSGGEIQKIALARAFVKECKYIILDEPSSNLDPIAEFKLYESMLKVCKDKTAIFISHRLSSTILADRIYMLENGEIVESGTHQELMDFQGKYAQMFLAQANSYS